MNRVYFKKIILFLIILFSFNISFSANYSYDTLTCGTWMIYGNNTLTEQNIARKYLKGVEWYLGLRQGWQGNGVFSPGTFQIRVNQCKKYQKQIMIQWSHDLPDFKGIGNVSRIANNKYGQLYYQFWDPAYMNALKSWVTSYADFCSASPDKEYFAGVRVGCYGTDYESVVAWECDAAVKDTAHWLDKPKPGVGMNWGSYLTVMYTHWAQTFSNKKPNTRFQLFAKPSGYGSSGDLPESFFTTNKVGFFYTNSRPQTYGMLYSYWIKYCKNGTLRLVNEDGNGFNAPNYVFWKQLQDLNAGIDYCSFFQAQMMEKAYVDSIYNCSGKPCTTEVPSPPYPKMYQENKRSFVFANKYAGRESGAQANSGFCALRRGLASWDSVGWGYIGCKANDWNTWSFVKIRDEYVKKMGPFATNDSFPYPPRLYGTVDRTGQKYTVKTGYIDDVTYDYWPGNYEMFLTQIDPESTSTGLWHLNEFDSHASWGLRGVYKGYREGNFARTTYHYHKAPNIGTGKMYFDINDTLAVKLRTEDTVFVFISYFDTSIGTSTSEANEWQLVYDSKTGSKIALNHVIKNTGAWKDTTIAITDGNFNNGLPGASKGADLILNNNKGAHDVFCLIEIDVHPESYYLGRDTVSECPNCWNTMTTSIRSGQSGILEDNTVLASYPNPFNSIIAINYQINSCQLSAISHQIANVSLSIYNIKGQVVKTLVNEKQKAGAYKVLWNGMDNRNKLVSSGIYYATMNINGNMKKIKMVLVK